MQKKGLKTLKDVWVVLFSVFINAVVACLAVITAGLFLPGETINYGRVFSFRLCSSMGREFSFVKGVQMVWGLHFLTGLPELMITHWIFRGFCEV